jgi:hypothetical protein
VFDTWRLTISTRFVLYLLFGFCDLHLFQLADAVGVELVREELTAQYVQLLKDNEAEVRTAAAGQIPGIIFFPVLARSAV